ncbi:MAG TPA: hypothetical protein VFI95_14285 [Terriglobales bacterium]|nr:hypothetical protein [Terriglobales bacterium]
MNRLCFLFIAVVLATPSMSATTVVVGSCRPKYPSYSTISQALAGVPAGSTILVCPGTYPEQITISQAVKLQGVINGNSGRAVITVPSSSPGAPPGLQVNVISQFTQTFLGGALPFAAQVLVESPAEVIISDITVDGTGGDMGCSSSNIWLAGIFYNSSSSLILDRIATRNQLDEGCGNGIWIEGSTGPSQIISVVNSSVHDFDYAGILAGTQGLDSSLAVAIGGNFVFRGRGSSSSYGTAGIASDFVNGTVASNIVTGGDTGIFNLSSAPLMVIKNNSVADTTTGISTGFDGGTIQHNQISNTSTAVDLQSNNATAAFNLIKNANVAIEFNCNSDSVSGNNINDAAIGLDNIPSGFVSTDHIFSVDTILTNCGLSSANRRKPPLKP